MTVGQTEWVTRGSFHLGCCTGVSCGPPLHAANGVVRGAVFQFGDVAVYSCFGGYAMEGVGRSRCLENGTWTPPPTCRGRETTPVCWQQGSLPISWSCVMWLCAFYMTPCCFQSFSTSSLECISVTSSLEEVNSSPSPPLTLSYTPLTQYSL